MIFAREDEIFSFNLVIRQGTALTSATQRKKSTDSGKTPSSYLTISRIYNKAKYNFSPTRGVARAAAGGGAAAAAAGAEPRRAEPHAPVARAADLARRRARYVHDYT